MPCRILLFILSNFRERGIYNYTISPRIEGAPYLDTVKNVLYIPMIYHGHAMFEIERILSLIIGVNPVRTSRSYSPSPSILRKNKPSKLSKAITIKRRSDYDCDFCNRIKNEEALLWDDGELVAFIDKRPASFIHILIVPKQHLSDISVLDKPDIPMLQRMGWLGAYLLGTLNITVPSIYKQYPPDPTQTNISPLPTSTKDYQLGFHKPQFTSQKHLHLHAMSLPVLVNEKKYQSLPEATHWVDWIDILDDLEEDY